MENITLESAADAPGVPLDHFWNLCVGAGRANEGLRADWQQQMRRAVAECGFRYVRFHGLFHDDMFVYREVEGQPVYNFQYIDVLFDALLEIGIRPFVEFGFCPSEMATEKGTVFWWKGHGSPPKDYQKWAALIHAVTAHWIERYGLEEVRSWYFEVWNEPNLHPFFRGTKSQYFELYRATAATLKALDAGLRVGGPSTSNFVPDTRFDGEKEDFEAHHGVLNATDLDAMDWQPVWVRQFLDFCDREKLPVDFVSCHPYPTDWALDEHGTGKRLTRGSGATARDLGLLKSIIAKGPFPLAEIHLTEWSSSSSPRDLTHDFLQAATFVVKANLDSIGLADSLSYWTFTDIFEESGAGDTIFHGGFGMLNLQGIPKPVFHAYRFLRELGDELLLQSPAGVITRQRATGKLAVLAFHYPPEMPLSVPASFDDGQRAREVLALGEDGMLTLALTGLKPHTPFEIETLSETQGNALHAWETLGRPAAPTREQTRRLQEMAAATGRESRAADAAGCLTLQRAIEPWSVVLLREI